MKKLREFCIFFLNTIFFPLQFGRKRWVKTSPILFSFLSIFTQTKQQKFTFFFSLFSFHHFPSKNFTHLIFFPLPFHSSQTIEIYIFLSLFLSPFSNPLPSSFETKGNRGRRAQHRGGIRSQTRISSPLNLIYDVNNIHFVFII